MSNKKILRGLPAQLEAEKKLGESELDYLLFNLPYACNLKCPKCFVGDNKTALHLSLDERMRVMREAKELGARVVVIPGEGEPLIAPAIKKIASYRYGLGLTAVVFTNATMLNEDFAHFAKDTDISFIVSLDSLDKGAYGFLTGRKDFFDETIKNIERCRSIYADENSSTPNGDKVVRLAVNTVVTKQNKDEISKIKDWCGDDMVFICNSPVKEGRAAQYWKELAGTEEEYRELKQVALKNSETHGPTSACSDGKCAYLYYGLTIGTDGDVLICPDARETRGLIGNVKEASLRELNKKHKQHLKAFFEECGYGPCIVRHPKYKGVVSK